MKNTAKVLPVYHCFFIIILASTLSLFTFGAASFAETQWDVGISGGKDGIDGFHLSVGDYYQVPEREVVVIRDRGVYDEELPVVFYLARSARVSPGAIVDLRLRGRSWMDITLHFGMSPAIYYVPVTIVEGRHPKGHAYGYYKNHPKRSDWKTITLSNADIINQVNLRFLSDRYGYSPDQVIKYRSEGRKFMSIDQDIRKEKGGGKKTMRSGADKGKNSTVKNGKPKAKDGNDKMNKGKKHEGKGKN